MSKLEDIVPPLELCKRIPAGAFEDSALVWKHHVIFFRGIDIMDQTDRVTFRADEQNDIVSTYSSTRYYPAPTLVEIRRELRNLSVHVIDGTITVSCKINPEEMLSETAINDNDVTAAALRLWFKVRGRNNE